MKILDVVPIEKGQLKENLSYYSAQDIAVGGIVSVPLRSRQVPALVIASRPVSDLKATLKSSHFSLKKIDRVIAGYFFLPQFIDACFKASDYFITTPGNVIKSFIPKSILEHEKQVKSPPRTAESSVTTLKADIHLLQEPDAERIGYYRSLIREAFARNTSVFFCLPTITNIEKILPELERGITNYTVMLHSKLPPKKIAEAWKMALRSDHPVLVIATPLYLSLPRHDLKTIIVDEESSSGYKEMTRPFIDARDFAEIYARKLKAKLVFGGAVLRTETIYRAERGELVFLSPPKYRLLSEAKQILINKHQPEPKPKREFRAISQELIDLIAVAQENNERTAIFTARKGLSPTTICSDCEATLVCKNCSVPLVVHKGKSGEDNIFLCHKCGETQVIDDACPHCGSWRLSLLGIGIDRIIDEIKKCQPEATIFKLESDSVRTAKQAKLTLEKFIRTPGSILIGTEMISHYLQHNVENIAAVGIDSLFTIPDFRMNEKMLTILLELRSHATKRFIIETRNTEEPLFNYALRGNILEFYREEIARRQQFNYPPLRTLIKITLVGDRLEVMAEMKNLERILDDYHPKIYPAFISEVKSKYRMHALIKILPEHWPDSKLALILKRLPPSFSIDVNPETIL